jgi:hypothetical protein
VTYSRNMQEASGPHQNRAWHRRAHSATCGLLPTGRQPPKHIRGRSWDTTPGSAGIPASSIDENNMASHNSSSIPRRGPSFRERFWTMSGANHHVDLDRERKQQQRGSSYLPTYPASGYRQSTSSAVTGPGPRDDHTSFLSQSEAADAAVREAMEPRVIGSNIPRRRASKRISQRIMDYIKPPREE